MSNVVELRSIIDVEGELWDAICGLRLDGYGRRDIMAAVRAMAAGNFDLLGGNEPAVELADAVSRAQRHGWTREQIIECASIECSASYDD
jgi:tRNA G37 N-methylase TrmD